jgi:uncharacterized protein (TIGR03382 family)
MTKWLGLFAPVLSLTACVDLPGTTASQQPIVGGQVVSTDDFPTTVGLEEGPGEWFCTGTLIDKDWVLTAAHCITEGPETVAKVHVRFDADELNTGSSGTAVPVAELHADPGFNEVDWDNDIAVIKLATSVTDRTPTPVHRVQPGFGTALTDVGYGDASPTGNGQGEGILRKLDTTNIDCGQANDASISNDNLLCFDASQHASCYGDSGGPTYVETAGGLEVAGVTSGGTADNCTGPNVFDLYTSVAAEIAFVDQFVPVAGNGGGSGSNTGSDGSGGDGGDGGPVGGTGGQGGTEPPHDTGGCAAGGSGGGIAFGLGIAAIALVRRRRR